MKCVKMYGFDYLLIVIIGIVGFIVQGRLQSVFGKYSQVMFPGGLTGAEVAEKMLRDNGIYDGAAYEGIGLLPALAEKLDFLFYWLFGFESPELVAFPMTSLGAVGAALGLVPKFQASGLIDGNAIAVFTAMGMCWSGYLSTHVAMMDTLKCHDLTGKAILCHTVGGLCAGMAANWLSHLQALR